MTKTILIVDDEPAITAALTYQLRDGGHRLLVAHSGVEAMQLLHEQPDLVILDVMLPDLDGYAVCKIIRRSERYIPVLMLTARDMVNDQVIGLDAGADVYMTKPFSPKAIVAQVNALLRFSAGHNSAESRCGDLTLDADARLVTRNGEPVALTSIEFDLLDFLMLNEGQVLGRTTLLAQVWHDEVGASSRTVDTHIQRLRAKLEPNPKQPRYIHTVRGFGYKFSCSV